MKKTILVLFLVFACVFTFACSNNTPDVQNPDPSDTTLSSDPTGPSDTTVPSDSDTTSSDVKRPVGGDKFCNVHSDEYHSYPKYIIDWVVEQGKDYSAWREDVKKRSAEVDSDCPYTYGNIYEFTEYFDIPREIWIEYYNIPVIRAYLNVDLLYDGSAEDNDKYYRFTSLDEEDFMEKEKWRKFKEMKHTVERLSKAEDKSSEWSLAQLAYTAGVTDLSTVLPVQDFKESSTEFIYNPDALSVLPEKDIDEIIEKYAPFYLDCLVCGVTPYNTPYERQVALNAAKK